MLDTATPICDGRQDLTEVAPVVLVKLETPSPHQAPYVPEAARVFRAPLKLAGSCWQQHHVSHLRWRR